MVRTRHHHFAAERLHRIVYTLVIGGYHYGIQGFTRLLVHTMNHRPVTNLCQRLPGKTGRTVTGRDDSDIFHIITITNYKLQITNLHFVE